MIFSGLEKELDLGVLGYMSCLVDAKFYKTRYGCGCKVYSIRIVDFNMVECINLINDSSLEDLEQIICEQYASEFLGEG